MPAGNAGNAQAPGRQADEAERAGGSRAVRWAAVLLGVIAAAGTAACAGPPSKGQVHGATLNQSRNNVVILAREPTADMSPSTLVNTFLQALTGDQKDPAFSVAQEYLTPDLRAKWIPAGSTWDTTTKIVNYSLPVVDPPTSADHGTHPALTSSSSSPAGAPAVGTVETVTVSGPEIAEINSFGFLQYERQPVVQHFKVQYLGAATGWRIATPPDFRMVTPDAFKRAYQTYQSPLPVYLPSHGAPTPQMDQVYLTQATGKVDYTYDALARAVLHGRYAWQDTNLELAAPVTVDATGLATVRLKAMPGGLPQLTDVQQALSQTFRDASETQQLLSSTPLSGLQLQVSYPGCGSSCEKPLAVSPESALTPTVYWVCPQGQNGTDAVIVSRQLTESSSGPAVCPANGAKVQSPAIGMSGIHPQKDSPIAVKTTSDSSDVKDPRPTTFAAVVGNDGSVVVVSDKNSDHTVWYTAQDPSKVTDLEWDPVDGSLWVVDDNTLYRVQDPGDKPAGPDTAATVSVPGLQVTRFKPSPDGLRAVVVSGQDTDSPAAPSGAPPATMVTIDRTGDLPTLSDGVQLLAGPTQTSDPQSAALQSVTDATWADGRTVVLLGVQSTSTTPKLYKVYLDGSQDSTILDPDDAQPAAEHIGAVTGVKPGHTSVWTFSDAPGPKGPGTTYSYFKSGGGADSFQEPGWSPVVATAG